MERRGMVGECHAAATCVGVVTSPLVAIAKAVAFIERAMPDNGAGRPQDRLMRQEGVKGCRACGVINVEGQIPAHLDGCVVNDLRAEQQRIDAFCAEACPVESGHSVRA